MVSLRFVLHAATLLAVICGFAMLTVIDPAAPAVDAQDLRDQIPIVAGTALELPGAHLCTAGAVLKSRSWSALAVPMRQATRYVVLAGHCADLDAPIKVGGQVVGSISWVSTTYDLEIAKIPPSTTQRPVCTGAYHLHHCSIPPATPRAVGRVILNDGSTQRAVPVPGFGEPAVNELFCTSGAVSFVNCSFRLTSVKPSPPWRPGEVATRSYSVRSIAHGDSGGPVTSFGGRLYGIMVVGGDNRNVGMMGYLPIALVLRDLGYAYGLAPA